MAKSLFLDTSVSVDRILKEKPTDLLARCNRLLASYDSHVTCAFSRLEFKSSVLQNLGLLLHYIRDSQSFFQAIQRSLRIDGGRSRRAAMLVGIAAWAGMQIDGQIEGVLGDEIDRNLALRVESYLRVAILALWKRFDRSVDRVVDQMHCKHALEGPRRLRNGDVDVAIPKKRCTNKECDNAGFFRSNLALLEDLRAKLQALANSDDQQITPELHSALSAIDKARANLELLFDYGTCRSVGDVWLHLECREASIQHFATTNYKESQVLCAELGLTMRLP